MEYPFKDLMPLDEVLEREGYYKDWTHLDPEVFYSLTQISNFIKTKGYGVDVRLLIAQLAEHFGLKTTQVVDLGNLLTAKHATLKTQVEQAVAQVNAHRSALETQFNQSVAQMETEKNAVIANLTVDSEVILARGDKPTLQARLDDAATQLAQTATVAGVSLSKVPDDSKTIAQAYPSVTLGQVQMLNPDATLGDSASWYYLQTILKTKNVSFWDHGNKRIALMGGTYSLSKPLDISELGDVSIDFSGLIIRPFGSYSGYLIQLHDSDRNTPHIYNLYLDGGFKSNGISIDWASFYTFTDLFIRNCVTGISLAATWYGSFEGTCAVRDCITSLKMTPSIVSTSPVVWEVNTINFLNFDIGGATRSQVTNEFALPETTKVVGIDLKCTVLGIKFIGITIESVDIAYYIDDSIMASNLNTEINNNYFENVREHILYQKVTKTSSYANLGFTNCLLNSGGTDMDCKISIVQGVFTITNMYRNLPKITIEPYTSYRPLILTTDVPRNLIDNKSISGVLQIYFKNPPLDKDNWDTKSYSVDGQGNNPPRLEVVNQTIQDSLGYVSELHGHHIQPTGDIKKRVNYKNIHSPSLKDLFFIDPLKGVVLKDRVNDKNYRLVVSNGILGVEEEKSVRKIISYTDTKPIEFFVNTNDFSLSGKYKMDMDHDSSDAILAKNGKWIRTIGGIDVPLVGTATDYKDIVAGAISGIGVYNKEIKSWYSWENGYWGWGTPYGINKYARLQKRAIGTTAQRPTGLSVEQTFFIYYDVDFLQYFKWNGSNWETYAV